MFLYDDYFHWGPFLMQKVMKSYRKCNLLGQGLDGPLGAQLNNIDSHVDNGSLKKKAFSFTLELKLKIN